MAVVFVQSKSATGSSATPSVTLTATATVGNLLVAVIANSGGNTATLSGWNALTDAVGGGGSSTRGLRMFWKIAAGTESIISGSISSTAWGIAVSEYSGVDGSSTLDVENAAITVSGTIHTTPTVNRVVNSNKLVVFGTMSRSNTTGWSTEQVNSSSTGVNEREDTQNGSNVTFQLADNISINSTTFVGAATKAGAAAIGSAGIAVFNVAATSSAALTGTITPSATEANIVTGGKTLIITITGDTWVASGATFDAIRQDIINGLTSAQSETFGWNAVVKATQGVAGVVRTSATVVTITLDAFATYNIATTETITATVPSTSLIGGIAIVATPTFSITPVIINTWNFLQVF